MPESGAGRRGPTRGHPFFWMERTSGFGHFSGGATVAVGQHAQRLWTSLPWNAMRRGGLCSRRVDSQACHSDEGEGLQMKSRSRGSGLRDGQRTPELRVALEALEDAKAFALTKLNGTQQFISGAFSLLCLSSLVSFHPPCNTGLRADLMRQRERAHLL
jgi:hypothetical protein